MKTRLALCAAVLGVTLLAAPDAFAKGGRRGGGNRRAVALSRPADGTDADASGTVRRESARGGEQTVLHLARLDPRTTYEVRDADTGETLGEVRTNRKGRATFNLTRNLRKSAAQDGADASGDVSTVEVVEADTEECVLEGGVDEAAFESFSYGFGDYSNDAGDAASISMTSAPGFGSESFAVSLFPIQESFAAAYFEMYRDTANGDKLPLGVAGVAELAGRAFEIRTPEGAALLGGTLPTLEEVDFGIDEPWNDDGGKIDPRWGDPSGIWAGPDGDWWDGGAWDDVSWDEGEWSDGGKDDGSDDWSDADFFDVDASGARHGRTKSAKAHRGVKEDDVTPDEPALSGYTLWIADGEGVLQDAGALEQVLFDQPIECPWDGEFGDGIVIGFIILPFDGDFDWEGALEDFLGSFDLGDFSDWFGGDEENTVPSGKLGHR